MKYLQQFVTTFLNVGGGIDASQTTGIVLQSLNNVDATKPSVACITWSDPLSTSVAEWVTYDSINSTTNELQGVTRGAEGYSAKTHLNQAVVAFPLSKAHVNELNAILTAGSTPMTTTLDEDDMASNSATALATQQSIKAYVDSGTVTMTNKRVTPRSNTATSHATPTINTDTTDIFTITAQAEAITSMTTNLSGTPVNGQKLIIRIKDNGTARAIAWGASFASRGATLPTTTVVNKTMYVGLIYNSTAEVWDCVAVSTEA